MNKGTLIRNGVNYSGSASATVENVLTSSSTSNALSANMGRVLNEMNSNLATTHDVLFNAQILTGETVNLTQSISGYRFLLFEPFVVQNDLVFSLSPIFMQTNFWVERHTQLLMEIGGTTTGGFTAFARIKRVDDTKININQVGIEGYTAMGLTLFAIR